MIRFLLDTDTVSLQERGDPAVLAGLRQPKILQNEITRLADYYK